MRSPIRHLLCIILSAVLLSGCATSREASGIRTRLAADAQAQAALIAETLGTRFRAEEETTYRAWITRTNEAYAADLARAQSPEHGAMIYRAYQRNLEAAAEQLRQQVEQHEQIRRGVLQLGEASVAISEMADAELTQQQTTTREFGQILTGEAVSALLQALEAKYAKPEQVEAATSRQAAPTASKEGE